MSKHTPGPWEMVVDPTRKGSKTDWRVLVRDRSFETVVVLGPDSDQHYANARLIAAAPDLLELLREIAESDGRCHVEQWQERARAALAKAEGQS